MEDGVSSGCNAVSDELPRRPMVVAHVPQSLMCRLGSVVHEPQCPMDKQADWNQWYPHGNPG